VEYLVHATKNIQLKLEGENMNFTKIIIAALCLLSIVSCSSKHKKHPHHHDKMMKSLLIKNDWIKVQKIELAPGKSRGMHHGGSRLIVALSDYQLQFEEEGSTAIEKSWKRGQVHWHEGKPHAIKNTGPTPARFLIITRLGDLPHSEGAAHLNKKGHSPALFENDWVKVTEANMKPGQQLPKHPGAIRAIVSMSDYEILYNSNCIKNRKSKFANESVHLHEADEHSLKNIGATDAHFLIIQFKK
jgi:hypothetical protein